MTDYRNPWDSHRATGRVFLIRDTRQGGYYTGSNYEDGKREHFASHDEAKAVRFESRQDAQTRIDYGLWGDKAEVIEAFFA